MQQRRADRAEDRAGEPDARLGAASSPSDFAATTAPRNGMNIGALASIPSRRSWITWPISCTSSSSTKPSRELPAPDQAVGGDRDEHRAGGRQQLELRQQQQDALELREPCADDGERAEQAAPPGTGLGRGAGRRPRAPRAAARASGSPEGAIGRAGPCDQSGSYT